MMRIICIRFPDKLLEELDKYVEDAHSDRSAIIRLAVEKYLKETKGAKRLPPMYLKEIRDNPYVTRIRI